VTTETQILWTAALAPVKLKAYVLTGRSGQENNAMTQILSLETAVTVLVRSKRDIPVLAPPQFALPFVETDSGREMKHVMMRIQIQMTAVPRHARLKLDSLAINCHLSARSVRMELEKELRNAMTGIQ